MLSAYRRSEGLTVKLRRNSQRDLNRDYSLLVDMATDSIGELIDLGKNNPPT